MKHVYKKNKIPNLARTKWYLRLPIIVVSQLMLFIGKNPQGIKEFITKYQWEADITNKRDRMRLMMKMVYYRYAYEISYKEFVSYRLEKKSRKQCLEYFPSYEKMRLYDEVICNKPIYDKFLYKHKTYEMYKKFYKREVVIFDNADKENEFLELCHRYEKLILKPTNSNSGKGVRIIDSSLTVEELHNIFVDHISSGDFLVEEYLTQCDVLSAFHSESVNTLRYTTYYKDGKLTKLYGMVRFGNNGSVVDNAFAGGFSANVDLQTGIINSNGFTHSGREEEYHPYSNVRFKGTQLPLWDEFNEMIEELVRICPEQHYIGWDFACTEDRGWVVIEANAGPGLQAAQSCGGKGFRPMLAETLFKESKHCRAYTTARL